MEFRKMGRSLVLSVSDFHMGFGSYPAGRVANVHEDFHRDEEFARLIGDRGTPGPYGDVRLVFNGDFLDVLLNNRGPRTRPLTARLALDMVQQAIAGHPTVFRALRDFNRRGDRSVHFVAGNHDPDLLLPAVQRALGDRVGGDVRFHPTHYESGDLLIEHGHLYDVMNGQDPVGLWQFGDDENALLTPPLGTILARGVVIPVKNARPLVHKIKPVGRYARWAMLHDPGLCGRMAWAFLRTFGCHLVGRDRRLADRFACLARRNVRRILRLDRFRLIESVARALLRLGSHSTVVFGHTHRSADVEVEEGKRYINTGTWSDVFRLDDHRIEPETRLSFAEIVLENGRSVDARLASWS